MLDVWYNDGLWKESRIAMIKKKYKNRICQSMIIETSTVVLYIFRIVRAFLIEEQKIVVKVLKAQAAAQKAK